MTSCIYKVRPLLDAVVENFQSSYSPSDNLSIDESMVGFKGRLAFLQYMPKKPQKWGMKSWVLADASRVITWAGTPGCTGSAGRRPSTEQGVPRFHGQFLLQS